MPYQSSAQDVVYECIVQHGSPFYNITTANAYPCDGQTGATGGAAPSVCSGWDPSAAVAYDSSAGAYEVDDTFIDALVADPTPLVACDGARIVASAGGGYEVSNATAGTFLYELGLRNQDVLLKLNGLSLSSFSRTASVFGDLWLYNGTTSYTLVVYRSGQQVTFNYEIVTP